MAEGFLHVFRSENVHRAVVRMAAVWVFWRLLGKVRVAAAPVPASSLAAEQQAQADPHYQRSGEPADPLLRQELDRQ